MKVTNYRDAVPVDEVEGVSRRDVVTADDGAPLFIMRVFDVEPGSSTPSHSHAWEHEVFVLSCKGVAVGEQGALPIVKESVIFVAPSEPHCFVNTGNEPLRFICCIPLQKGK